MKALWNGQILAESDETVIIENNHYFPPKSVNKDFFEDSDLHTVCPWKGEASYYHLKVDDEVNENAAWYYPKTKELAKGIEGYVAFWKGVEVSS